MTKWRARPLPARSASRWVPPIDGVSPTTFSTRPNFAFGEATIRSQASASSKAAVRVSAWAAKTTGAGSASTWSIIPSSSSHSSFPCSGVSPAKTLTSTPPETARPSARISSARGGSALTASTAARRSSIIRWSKRFSGGLSRVIVARPLSSRSSLAAALRS